MATPIQSPVSSSLPTSINAFPTLEVILNLAKERVSDHMARATGVQGLDPSVLVIEEEFGDLVYTQGDLSFLMPGAPILHKTFAGQLNSEIQDEYDSQQLAVWEQLLVYGEQFQVENDWNAAILPFFAEEERFTVTVFIRRTTN